MRLRVVLRLLARDLRRALPSVLAGAAGIAVGITALVCFVALGLGARRVLLGEVFPIDRVELEPRRTGATLLSLLAGRQEPPGIEAATVDELRSLPGVLAVAPKLRFRFPGMARGGRSVLGQDVYTDEILGDGIDPTLIDDPAIAARFRDPMASPGPECLADRECAPHDYCERPDPSRPGRCSAPVPALVSRYLLELFDHGIAPAHGLPPIGESLVRRATGLTATVTLGKSVLGVAPQGTQRTVKVELVGVSDRAIDLGMTLPLEVVRRWNREYAGAAAGQSYSSVVVRLARPGDAATIISWGEARDLVPRDTRARDVSVLIQGMLAILLLGASAVLAVAALNIAQTLRTLVLERRRELALYRALGATSGDMRGWVVALATLIASAGTLVGLAGARLVALGVDRLAHSALPEFPFKPDTFFAFPPWLLLLALGFALGFAGLGAIGPARRAGAVDPARGLAEP